MGKTQNINAPAQTVMADLSHYKCEMEDPRNCRKPLFWSLLSGIRRQPMALREEDVLTVLEMGQITGKPQLQFWGGTEGKEAL